ncbi:hypothetical protein [Methylobacterium soli]|uniref:hypothetical protein n=1 Tax=Methylobacterium soli TaxID=553447 RepID=UPI00177B61BF|nr:hypothetical protein [Methylobacterium soli]GJE46809.1 hypothetical protein AEGHOMDF_6018 [Methylobacterium soli]
MKTALTEVMLRLLVALFVPAAAIAIDSEIVHRATHVAPNSHTTLASAPLPMSMPGP